MLRVPSFRSLLLLLIAAAAMGCGGDALTAPGTGTLQITTTTSGTDPDPDGYAVQIDGGSAQPIGVSASVQSTDLTAGNHIVQLAGLAPNCTVSDNPRTVSLTAGGTVTVTFAVTCSATAGSIQITTATTGSSLDPDGYTLSVNGGASQSIGINATLTIGGLTAGAYTLALSGIAGNCNVVGANPVTVTVTAGVQAPAAFTLECLPITAGNTWVSKQPTLTARQLLQAGTINGTIYAVGGTLNDGGPVVSVGTVEAYSVATNTWVTRQPLPSALSPNGVSVIDGRLYVAGGQGDNTFLKTLYIYDPIADSWTRKADLPGEAGCGAQGVIGGLLYVYSGCTSEFFSYNPATDAWVTLRAPPMPHAHSAAGVIDGKFYLAGAGARDGALHVYDPATNTWARKAPMLLPLDYPASGVVDGKLYVAGGTQGPDQYDFLQVYDPATDSWSSKASMPTARWGGAGVVANGQLFVIGGILRSGYATTAVEAYTP